MSPLANVSTEAKFVVSSNVKLTSTPEITLKEQLWLLWRKLIRDIVILPKQTLKPYTKLFSRYSYALSQSKLWTATRILVSAKDNRIWTSLSTTGFLFWDRGFSEHQKVPFLGAQKALHHLAKTLHHFAQIWPITERKSHFLVKVM